MKIGFLSTVRVNIGDELIRYGIENLMRARYGESFEAVVVNKHNPASAYPAGHFLHKLGGIQNKYLRVLSTELASLTCYKRKKSLFDDCDLLVQSGMPVFFHGAWRTEWSFSIWHEIIGRLSRNVPVVNLAAGSCYPWEERDNVRVHKMDRWFIRKILGYCKLTTVREDLAKTVVQDAGIEVESLPCTAFLAGYGRTLKKGPDSYVFLNYMPGAGHQGWIRQEDSSRWEQVFNGVVERLRDQYNLAFICHDQREHDAAEALAPDLPRFFPKTPKEYLDVAELGVAGIFNRMHACVGMAGLGIPSIALGMDTRMMMVKKIGLSAFHASTVDVDMLVHEFAVLMKKRDEESARLRQLSLDTYSRYCDLLSGVLPTL